MQKRKKQLLKTWRRGSKLAHQGKTKEACDVLFRSKPKMRPSELVWIGKELEQQKQLYDRIIQHDGKGPLEDLVRLT